MKKTKCEKYKYYIGSAFLGLLGISNIFGLQQWNKYYGWQEPSKIYGIALIATSISIYMYINKFCVDIKIVKCKNCGEAFSELKLNKNKCPECDGDTIDINKYYEVSNKH